MLAVYAARFSADDPVAALEVGERPDPQPLDGWVTVSVRAAALNHHDIWSLRGVGLTEKQLPMILGCDAAGIDEEGNEVVVHAVIGDPDARGGDETYDAKRSLLSEKYDGTLAEKVVVPRRNLVPKPAELSFAEAACLPTAWLTAYKMLFTRSGTKPGDTVLVQGAGGGVATAAIAMARAAGLRVWATSRSEDKRKRALNIGAHDVFESGARLPARVDAVIDSVGEATLEHSVKSCRPGGRVVLCGATSGRTAQLELARVFFNQVDLLGSTMGNARELRGLVDFLVATGVRPLIDSELPLTQARDGFARMLNGDVFGKVVFTI
ncbi:MAG TPA: zinc-binding dehydrogenase [Mycobacteriales bacterium]|nr:zinc-binding dehydrogenase [Mycobacteriales bacterium]